MIVETIFFITKSSFFKLTGHLYSKMFIMSIKEESLCRNRNITPRGMRTVVHGRQTIRRDTEDVSHAVETFCYKKLNFVPLYRFKHAELSYSRTRDVLGSSESDGDYARG